jgi:hypothetical protein
MLNARHALAPFTVTPFMHGNVHVSPTFPVSNDRNASLETGLWFMRVSCTRQVPPHSVRARILDRDGHLGRPNF